MPLRRVSLAPLVLLAVAVGCTRANPTRHRGALLGHEFVAEGLVYTAGHVEPGAREVSHDLVTLGRSGRRGFEVCREPHAGGDPVVLLFETDAGRTREVSGTVAFHGEVFAVEVDLDLYPGLSGAPVLCASHRRVLGAIVAGEERTGVVTPMPRTASASRAPGR